MCLYPKMVLNPKYQPNKKNNGLPPRLWGKPVKYVPIGCGVCIECRKQKANEWKVRLGEEIKQRTNGVFVTLTFNEKSLIEIASELGIGEGNAIATFAVRRFLERWRKKYKKSVKHWLITEMGHQGTERIHLHGIIFTDNKEDIEKIWKYGFVYLGKYVNQKTINYIIKYVTKEDKEHPHFKAQILSSAGIGAAYQKTNRFQEHTYKGKETKDYYQLKNGTKVQNPIYYRNKLYTEEEREQMWIDKINEHKIYIMGIPYDVKTAKQREIYNEALKNAQALNERIGGGKPSKEWAKEEYNIKLKEINGEGR